MAATDAKPIPIKNTAYRITFPILDADGDLVTAAASLDSEVSKDGGTFADCTNEATEIATSSGMYFLDLTSTEMNADTVAVIVKTATAGAKTTSIVMYPQESGDINVNIQSLDNDVITAAKIATDAIGASELAQAAADKVWSSTTRTLTALGASLVQEIWDRATSALTVVGSIGKLLVDNINATISSRATQTSVDTVDDFLDTEIAAIKAKTDNLPEGIQKNAVLNNFMFMMIDSTDDVSPKTGLTVTAERSIDGAAFAACANAVTEVANGWYKINLAATDLNGDVIALKFTGTGANATNITIKTEA